MNHHSALQELQPHSSHDHRQRQFCPSATQRIGLFLEKGDVFEICCLSIRFEFLFFDPGWKKNFQVAMNVSIQLRVSITM